MLGQTGIVIWDKGSIIFKCITNFYSDNPFTDKFFIAYMVCSMQYANNIEKPKGPACTLITKRD